MPLAAYCASGCMDNGTNSPSNNNPPVQFGWMNSPDGLLAFQLRVIILLPDTAPLPASIMIVGSNFGTATNIGTWTGGNLDAVLGISATPPNPLGAFLPAAQLFWPTATGFAVFQASFTAILLESVPNHNPLFDLYGPLPAGSFILAFAFEGAPPWIPTSNSGAIFVGGPITTTKRKRRRAAIMG